MVGVPHRSKASDCPAPERIVALAAGDVDAAQRSNLLEHIADCTGCRHALIAAKGIELERPSTAGDGAAVAVPPEVLERVRQLVPSRPRVSTRARLLALAAAIALAVGLSWVAPWQSIDEPDVRPSPLRASASAGGPRALESELLGTADSARVRFSWRQVASAERHLLVVVDAAGHRLLELDAGEPPLWVPLSDVPTAARAWWIEAVLADGSERISEPVELHLDRSLAPAALPTGTPSP